MRIRCFRPAIVVTLMVLAWSSATALRSHANAAFSPSAWPQDTGAPVNSSPVLGDIDRDGMLEIVIGSDNHKVYAWKPDGALMPGWPVTTNDSVRSTPALADLDGDGALEVIVGSFDNKVYAWNYHGSLLPGWPASTGSVIYSSPAVGDIDGDQMPEIVIGSFDNKVYAWNADGTLVRGWPKPTGLFVYSSPALADIDRDGVLDVVIGTDNNRVFAWKGDGTDIDGWPVATEHVVPSSPAVGDIDEDGKLEIVAASWDKVFVWNTRGERKPGWPITAGHQIPSSPALADLNNDGRLEIIIGCKDGKVYAWDANGQAMPGWPSVTDGEISGSPVVGDVDGDGNFEVAIGSKDMKVYLWTAQGVLMPGWPRQTKGAIASSPAFGDTDGDGTVEMVIGSKDQFVYAWTLPRVGAQAPQLVWQHFRGNAAHSGRYGDALPVVSAAQPRVIPQPQTPETSEVLGDAQATPQPPLIPNVEGQITDLTVADYDRNSMTLTWTAPPGIFSAQAVYELRFSAQPITLENWESSMKYTEVMQPSPPGTREVLAIKDLRLPTQQAGALLYLALRIIDKTGQAKPISNVVRLEQLDEQAPAAITELAVRDVDEKTLELSWKATGDDGDLGTAATYDIRYSDVPLTELSWVRAVQLTNVPAPLPAGTAQTFQVLKPWTEKEMFWGIRAIDDALNISPMSESVEWSPKDIVPPSRIVDLRVTETTGDSVTLGWTAPGENAETGKTAQYDIRYAEFPLTDADWETAARAPQPPTPEMSGAAQTFQLSALPVGKRVFIGMKSIDADGNVSVLSNIVEAQLKDTTPPRPVNDLMVEEAGRDWMKVSWTALADGDNAPSVYLLRYGADAQTVMAWKDAVDVPNLPAPSPAGTKETVTITGLKENSAYVIGLRLVDKDGNSSDISNLAEAKTLGRPAPEIVADLAIEEMRKDGVALTWTAPQQQLGEQVVGVSGYEMRYALEPITDASWDMAVPVKNLPKPSAPKTLETFFLQGAPTDSAYYIALRSVDELGNLSAISNVLAVPKLDAAPPAPIFDLAVEDAGKDWIRITWTASGDNENQGQAAKQLIRIAPNLKLVKNWQDATDVPNDVFPAVAGSRDSFTITGLASNSTYFIAVKSADAFGNESEMSNIVRAKTLDTVAPGAINDLQVAAASLDGVVIKWTAPGENEMQGQAKSYDVRYSQNPITSDNWDVLPAPSDIPSPKPAGSTEKMMLTGLQPNTTYYVAVIALDASGNPSPISNVAQIATADTVSPEGIASLQAENVDSNSAFLSWISPGDDDLHDTPSGYEIRYAREPLNEDNWQDAKKAADSPKASLRGEKEQFLLSGLQNNSLYYIGVKAFDAGGNASPISNVVRIYTADDVVKDLQILAFNQQNVTLAWTAPGGVLPERNRVYDIRYATTRISEETWDQANPVRNLPYDALLAKDPGQKEEVELTGLPQYEQLFFAVRLLAESAENQEQRSKLSNVVELNRLDIVPPGEITTFELKGTGKAQSGMRSLTFAWQAPGDNDFEGAATRYDIRYGKTQPSEATWETLTSAQNPPQPEASGSLQEATIQIPDSEETVYFVIRAYDEALNISALSNIAQWSPQDAIAPASVLNLRAERLENGDVKITWTAPGDNQDRGTAAFYDLRYAGKEGDLKKWNNASVVPGEPLPEIAGTAQEYLLTGLRQDTTYYIGMKTTDDVRNTSQLSNIAVLEKLPPQSISDLAFMSGAETSVTLMWTAPQDRVAERVVSYDIRYSEDRAVLEGWKKATVVKHGLTPRESGSRESITLEQLAPNKRYYVAIKAVDHSKETSSLSNIVVAYTADTMPPKAVTDLSVAQATTDSLTLRWTVAEDDAFHDVPQSYELRYSAAPISAANWNAATLVVKDLPASALAAQMEYTVTGLEESARYQFAVRAIDKAGNVSDLSNALLTQTNDATPPQAVADLRTTYPTSVSVSLSWTCPADVVDLSDNPLAAEMQSGLPLEDMLIKAYDIRYLKLSAGTPLNEQSWEMAEKVADAPAPVTPGTPEEFVVRNLEPDQTYAFAIKAVDSSGNISAISNVVIETTLPADWATSSVARAAETSDSLGWKLAQGQSVGQLKADASGQMTLSLTGGRSATAGTAMTAVYPATGETLAMPQAELRFAVNGSAPFFFCAKVNAVDSEEMYHLCYASGEQASSASGGATVQTITQSPRARIENYVFFKLADVAPDGQWHDVRRDLAQDLLEGAGHTYRSASQFYVRGSGVSLRGIVVEGIVFTPVADFENRLSPLDNGWKLHFGVGTVELMQEPLTGDAGLTSREMPVSDAGAGENRMQSYVMSGVVARGIQGVAQTNFYLHAKSDDQSNIVLTYPQTGMVQVSDKPYFLANVRAGAEFKMILKVQTRENKDLYVAYVPASDLQANTATGNYLYFPLYTVPAGGGWMQIIADVAGDLQKRQIEYLSTTWLSFHGREISLDNIGFSTNVLQTSLK